MNLSKQFENSRKNGSNSIELLNLPVIIFYIISPQRSVTTISFLAALPLSSVFRLTCLLDLVYCTHHVSGDMLRSNVDYIDFPFLHRCMRSDMFFSISSLITVFRLSGIKINSLPQLHYGIFRFEPFLHFLSKLPNVISFTLDSYRLELPEKYPDYIFPKIRNLHFSNIHFETVFFRRFHLNHYFPSLDTLSFNDCPKLGYPIIPLVCCLPLLTDIHIDSIVIELIPLVYITLF